LAALRSLSDGGAAMTLGNPNLKDRPLEYTMTDPGMAFFAGTGPAGSTCENCAFRGYSRRSTSDVWNPATQEYVASYYRVTACAKFRDLTGAHGPNICGNLHACKYFQKKEKA
jgi:hypothetical protein